MKKVVFGISLVLASAIAVSTQARRYFSGFQLGFTGVILLALTLAVIFAPIH